MFTLSQRLAYYLTQSGLVDPNKVKKFLGESDTTYEKCTPESTGNFPSHILGKLAKVIATRQMEGIALGYLGFTAEQVQDTRFNNIRNSELFNLAILEKYALEKDDTLEVIIFTILARLVYDFESNAILKV